MEYVRHHFIPQFLLKNYSKEKDDDGDELINVYNNFTLEVDKKKVSNAYMVKNLYDSTQFKDIKQLEKDFGKYIENRVAPILKKLIQSDNEFIINREELKLLKKYLLITIYRSEANMTYYLSQNIKDKMELSNLSIRQNESKLDFWKREMYTIVHNDWDYLSSDECDIDSVHLFSSDMNQSHLCVFETNNEEFLINDLGRVSELIPFQINKDEEKYFTQVAEYLFLKKLTKTQIDNMLRNKNKKLETFMFFPISPNKAIVVAKKSRFGKFEERHYEKSITLHSNRFLPPRNEYINNEVYSIKNKIQENYKNLDEDNYIKLLQRLNDEYDDNDKFIYSIQQLNVNEVIKINCLMLNESKKCFSFKNSSNIRKSIRAYNDMFRVNISNIKNNFLGYESVIKKC